MLFLTQYKDYENIVLNDTIVEKHAIKIQLNLPFTLIKNFMKLKILFLNFFFNFIIRILHNI